MLHVPNAGRGKIVPPCNQIEAVTVSRSFIFALKGYFGMSGYGSNGDMTYAEWLQWKSVGAMPRTHATKDQVTVHREDGQVVAQTVRDQLGHETTEHASGRVDVTINLGGPGGDL